MFVNSKVSDPYPQSAVEQNFKHNLNINFQVSCRKTFEENFADYAGVNLAYEAYDKYDLSNRYELPGLTYESHQLFWISYASTMCSDLEFNNTEAFTHMLPNQRIMGSFRNSYYFSNDFKCPVGSNMNPKKKCQVF